MGSSARHCSSYRTFNKWGNIYGVSLQRLQCGMMVYKTKHAEASESHHISEVGGFWEGRSTCFCVDNSFLLPLASDGDGLHKSTDFFWAVVVSVMSHDCTGLCPVPRTDNKAPHWSSHTDAASCFASFERWTSWKNVKHPGNPRKALLCSAEIQ